MKVDYGLVIVIVAVLIFYLRLIIIQRERVRRARVQAISARKKKSKKTANTPMPTMRFAILSRDRRDWIIAGVGAALIILGILFYAAIIPLDWARSVWWLPTALGIVAFSWGFK
jgi:hypothetical protein